MKRKRGYRRIISLRKKMDEKNQMLVTKHLNNNLVESDAQPDEIDAIK